VDRLSAEQVVDCLEAAGVSINMTAVVNALSEAGDLVFATMSKEYLWTFRIMTKGKREIENLLGSGLMKVVRIEGGQPRTARRQLSDMLAELKGTVRICDPYYGVRTLESLDHLPNGCGVRFLTAKTSESAQKIQGTFRDFTKERPNTEFRIAANPSDLHDRYVLTDDSLLILGHGLKDIGGKESFMIRLGQDLAPDLLHDLTTSFDARWQRASAL
jgi:hypothetical protein